jgi:pre-mRNA-processing factor 19
VRSLSFSENGYYLATSAEDGVKVWDLRKLKAFKSIEAAAPAALPLPVRFDFSGLYLAVGGEQPQVFGVKQDWAALAGLAGALGNKAGPLLPPLDVFHPLPVLVLSSAS